LFSLKNERFPRCAVVNGEEEGGILSKLLIVETESVERLECCIVNLPMSESPSEMLGK
jgi:hypothetical protein